MAEFSSAQNPYMHTSVLLRSEAGVKEFGKLEVEKSQISGFTGMDGMRGEFIEEPIMSGLFKIFYRLS